MQRETLEEISATVVSVDPKTRIIELRGEEGRTGAFTAGPEVKNFAQIHTGDKVVVSYYRALQPRFYRPVRPRTKSARSTWAARRSPAPSPALPWAAPSAAR